MIWKNYKCNDQGKSDLFNNVDRIKILEWQVTNVINIGHLAKLNKELFFKNYDDRGSLQKYLGKSKLEKEFCDHMGDIFFPLHNYNQLNGDNYKKLFKPIFEEKSKFSLVKNVKNHNKRKFKIKNIMDKLARKLKNILKVKNGEEIFETKKKTVDLNINQNHQNENKTDIEIYELENEKREKYDAKKEMKKLKIKHLKIKWKKKKEDEVGVLKSSRNEYLAMDITKKVDKDKKKEKNKKKIIKKFKKDRKNKNKLDKQTWPLKNIFDIPWIAFFNPWLIPVDPLILYFGERIGLYFKFIVFFLKFLTPLNYIGIIFYALDNIIFFFEKNNVNENSEVLEFFVVVIVFILAFSICVWSLLFFYFWKKKEKEFNLFFGQSEEIVHKERLNFKNFTYKRSLVDDFLNNKANQTDKQSRKFLVAIFVTFLFYGVSFGISIGLFYLKDFIIEKIGSSDSDGVLIAFLRYKQNIINTVEVLKVYFLDRVFYHIAMNLCIWIDPKYMKEFEKYFIFLLSLFGILNNFFIIVFIFFFRTRIFDKCAANDYSIEYKDDCLFEAETYFRTYIIIGVIWNLMTLCWTTIKNYQKKNKNKDLKTESNNTETQKQKIKKQNTLKKQNLTINKNKKTGEQILQKGLLSKLNKKTVDEFSYAELNLTIEKQIYLKISNNNDDFDATLQNYYQLFLYFSTITLFGILFPLTFLFIYITTFLELFVDKNRYFKLIRRPSPLGYATIGIWAKMVYVISTLSIISNGYIFCYKYSKIGDDEIMIKHSSFVIFIILEEITRTIISMTIGADSENFKMINRRQNFIVDKIMMNRKGASKEEGSAFLMSKLDAMGEIDYEFAENQMAQEKQKILDSDDDY